jgi:hypothetical protein
MPKKIDEVYSSIGLNVIPGRTDPHVSNKTWMVYIVRTTEGKRDVMPSVVFCSRELGK